jgi:hypothetical protein
MLPPYSPDFNPIEESFAEFKMWIKNHRALAEDCQNLEEYLRLGLSYMGGKAGNHFKSCHIVNYPIRHD